MHNVNHLFQYQNNKLHSGALVSPAVKRGSEGAAQGGRGVSAKLNKRAWTQGHGMSDLRGKELVCKFLLCKPKGIQSLDVCLKLMLLLNLDARLGTRRVARQRS